MRLGVEWRSWTQRSRFISSLPLLSTPRLVQWGGVLINKTHLYIPIFVKIF